MKNLLKSISLCLILVQFITGCSVTYKVLLGVNTNPNWKSNKQIAKKAKRYNISTDCNFILDTASYYNGLTEIYSTKIKELTTIERDSSEYFALKQVLKDDAQPTQFRLFDKNGAEIFKIVNCYVDPLIPMNWNVNRCFDEFPPSIDIKSLNSHNYDLNFLLKRSSSLDNKKIALTDIPQSDYYGVILWNNFLQRPSRKLIKTVKKYIEDSEQSVYLIFINNQNAYLWEVMDSETRKRVRNTLHQHL